MFDHIAGQLVRKDLTVAVLRAGGVGYHLSIPVSTYEMLPAEGRDVILYTHLAVRENDMRLYGFASLAERVLFQILVQAKGIGPASALVILSGSSIEQFAAAVADEDADALARIRGIGKKTARRIIVDIKEDVIAFSQRYLAHVPVADSAGRDAVMALVSLGLPSAAARKGVEIARKADPSADVEQLVRAVLSDGAPPVSKGVAP